jgi:hypothetical protein
MLLSSASGAQAQSVGVNLDAGVSHARPPSGATAQPSTYAMAGTRISAGPAFASAYGALRVDGDAGDWLAASLGARLAQALGGGWSLALNVNGAAFTVADPTPYQAAVARAAPEARYSAGGTTVALRAHGGIGRSESTDFTATPDTSVLTDLWLYGGTLELGQRLGPLHFRAGAEVFRTAGGTYRSAYVSSRRWAAGLPWSVRVQLWDTPGDVELQVDFSLTIPLAPRWSAELAGGQAGPDPLLGTLPGGQGSLLLSWNVVEPRLGPPPVYSLGEGEPGEVVFRLDRLDARAVSLAGDFSEWQPIAMQREKGVWVARIKVAPGVYHFGFLVDGEWHVPKDAPGIVTDEFGAVNATLVVPAQ